MSFQTFVTETLASLSARLNAIATNAKKIDELPPQQNIDPISRIHVSRQGISERIELGQIIEQIKNSTYDEIIAVGNPIIVYNSSKNINEVIVPEIPIPTWRINNIYYSKNSVTKKEIPFANSGLNRYDILLLNTFNDIVIQRGVETAGIAVIPTKPINTIILSEIYVTDNAVEDPSTPVDFSNKLDKGGYIGTAKMLADSIDAIFVPDQLISGVAPTRSVNTFTYPALGYIALISKTLRTNPAQFITTITATSTTNHKRVDLIYFKPDNTLAKFVGTEDLVSAPRPDVPPGSVGVSFINVFGNVIDDSTPITNEISIQDHNGIQKYVTPNFLRFRNVTFDEVGKVIIIEPLVPLSAFLDPIYGVDSSALIENSNRPFKTMAALVAALPVTTGETYTIYITGGNIDITRLMPSRNLRFIAYTDCTLNFTNVKLDDGITHSTYVIRNSGGYLWSFENNNISIKCFYLGQKGFCSQNPEQGVALKGFISSFEWRSTNDFSFRGSILGNGTDVSIGNLYDSEQDTLIFGIPSGFAVLRIGNYNTKFKKWICGNGQTLLNLTVDNIVEIGSSGSNMYIQALNLKIGNVINFNGMLYTRSYESLSINGNLSDNCIVNLVGNPLVTGNITSKQYMVNEFIDSLPQVFRNFSGKLRQLVVFGNGQVTFENCNINVKDELIFKLLESGREDILFLKGSNTIFQDNKPTAVYPLIRTQDVTQTTEIQHFGNTTTNVDYYGKKIRHVYETSSFREELNKVTIRSKYDLLMPLLSEKKYIIDVSITDFGPGEYIIIPVGGLTFGGNGIENSVLGKNVAGEEFFKSAVGGSGDLIIQNIKIKSGAGSVFNISDINGSHTIEIENVNFEDSASLGSIDKYRQFTGQTIGVYGCSDGLTLTGNWNGFVMSKLHVRTFGVTGTLFKKNSTTKFSNRFNLGVNMSGASGGKLLDFDSNVFIKNRMLQLDDCVIEVDGVIDELNTTSLIPNIGPNDPKCKWTNSEGISLTALRFLDMKSPDGNIWKVTVSNAGVLTVSDL